ncbi:MAG: hypothetical protein ACD_75C01449G0001 [uncultured bacterium]|nr:MAG: hypothetical protein ACD_75C01449G0001 [uncultured bacterium]
MAERLHEQIGLEPETGQLGDFLHGHRPGGVLGAYGGHFRFADRARQNPRHPAGPADKLLGQTESPARLNYRILRFPEDIREGPAEGGTGQPGQLLADNEVEPAPGAVFVEQGERRRFQGDPSPLPVGKRPVMRAKCDGIAGGKFFHLALDGQNPRIAGRGVEDRGDYSAENQPARSFIGDMGNIRAGMPEQGVYRRFPRRTGADHIAGKGDQAVVPAQPTNGGNSLGKTCTAEERGVEGNIGPGLRLIARRKVIGVDFPINLIDLYCHRLRQWRRSGKPFGSRPGFDDLPGINIGFCQLGDPVKTVIDLNQPFQRGSHGRCQGWNFQQLNQGMHIVAAAHRPQHGNGLFRVYNLNFCPAKSHILQPLCFNLSRFADSGLNPALDETEEKRTVVAAQFEEL